MRLNRYISLSTGLGRRKSDQLIEAKKVTVNGKIASLGQEVYDSDNVQLNNKTIAVSSDKLIIIINKPKGYVVSRNGQGSKTIYNLLPTIYHNLKPIGRLDKDSSGVLLLSNDGDLSYKLTHPKFEKDKIYRVKLNKKLLKKDLILIKRGVKLIDGISKMKIESLGNNEYKLILKEGKNRQIRRTFVKLGYSVVDLDRTSFYKYSKGGLKLGEYRIIDTI